MPRTHVRALSPLLFAALLSAPAAFAKPRPASRVAKSAAAIPLTPREQATQLLNRFTFGPRPGEVDQVAAEGISAWLDRQLNPAAIDDAALDRRLNDYPTLRLSPAQALAFFPDRGVIQRVAENKQPYPADPLLASVYEVQVYKLNQEKSEREHPPATPPTDADKAAQKRDDQATASRIAGELFALPRQQRLAALDAMPVPDRIAFAAYVAGDQRNTLFNEMTPRERETVYAMQGGVGASYRIGDELAQARILRDILSERQLQQVMTAFWFNHFNIFIDKDSDQWYTTAYERDVIRPHALGKFRDLLLATAQSPTMMVYLDNWLSIGPDSLANGVNPKNPKSKPGNRGLNENYGREVMELHTLGVNGGYSQQDVTHLSAILTGWSVDQPNLAGPFQYDARRHQPGTKQWLGYTLDDSGNILAAPPNAPSTPPIPASVPAGMRQGYRALEILAAAPQTAHFLSTLLAQRFLADNPPPALVDRLSATWLATDGDIAAVLRSLITSPEFNSRRYFRNKVKMPEEFVASAFRVTATDPQNPGALVGLLANQLGEPLYRALPPTGYYVTADQWMNTQALMARLNFADQLTHNRFANQKFDSARVLALGLMSQSAQSAQQAAVETARPRITPVSAVVAPAPTTAAGPQLALATLEQSLVQGDVSRSTQTFIQGELAKQSAANPADTLNLLTALLLGSPEFQDR